MISPRPRPSDLKILTLCTLALETVVPSISTGSNIATGFISPVLDALHSISKSLVSTSSSFHLKAIECLGNLAVRPRLSPYDILSYVSTNPSEGKSFFSTSFAKYSTDSAIFFSSTTRKSTVSKP